MRADQTCALLALIVSALPAEAQECPPVPCKGEEAASPACWLTRAQSSVLDAFFADDECVPAMVFPLDESAGTPPRRGAVIIGTERSRAAMIAPRTSLGETWASATAGDDQSARCLASIDFCRSPAVIVTSTIAAIATFYANWCPHPDCSAAGHGPDAREGLGLAISSEVEKIVVKSPLAPNQGDRFERFAFSRGTLYAESLAPARHVTCSEVDANPVSIFEAPYFDPLVGPILAPQVACVATATVALSAERPASFMLLPPAIDAALTDSAVRSGEPLDGLPFGLVADARMHAGLARYYLLGARAAVARTSNGAAWVVVPRAIAEHGQHLIFDARVDFVERHRVAPLAPMEAARYGSFDALSTRRVSQPFRLHSKDGVRTIETLDHRTQTGPRRAATFDDAEEIGTSWTTNIGPFDCYATTLFDEALNPFLRFPYPTSAGSGDHSFARAWCPIELHSWIDRTRPILDSPGRTACSTASEDLQQVVTHSMTAIVSCLNRTSSETDAGTSCAPPDDAGTPSTVEAQAFARCAAAGCDPLRISSCPNNRDCLDFLAGASQFSDEAKSCIANTIVQELGKSPLPSQHWADVLDAGESRMIPMVGFITTTRHYEGQREPGKVGLFEERSLGEVSNEAGSLRSEMARGDAFARGAHQTNDWNWSANALSSKPIDPAYRAIAIRRGYFVGIDNELEMGIPAGLWSLTPDKGTNSKCEEVGECACYTDHHCEFTSFLSGGSVERFGEIWPVDHFEYWGLDRGPSDVNPSIPSLVAHRCVGGKLTRTTSAAIDHAFWRAHFGRGLFSPLTEMTADPAKETSWMVMNTWPREAATRVCPLGLQRWDNPRRPHRLALLGRPILDCGHGEDEGPSASRLEIHPAHVVSMDLADVRACNDEAGDCWNGRLHAVFGWSGVFGGRHLEFDIWPPKRAELDSELCAIGLELAGDGNSVVPVETLGMKIDTHVPPGCAPTSTRDPPRLVCRPAPQLYPDHVHCTYDDPAAEHGHRLGCSLDELRTEGKFRVGNPRMTPAFATSRFEARIFVGWKPRGNTTCERAKLEGMECKDL